MKDGCLITIVGLVGLVLVAFGLAMWGTGGEMLQPLTEVEKNDIIATGIAKGYIEANTATPVPQEPPLPGPSSSPIPADTSVFANADKLAVSEFTAVVRAGGEVFTQPMVGLASFEGYVEEDTQVRILGFDYTSEGWLLVQFDRPDGPVNRWVRSYATDLPDGSVALHQLPELVK